MAKNRPSHAGALYPAIEDNGLFAVLGQKGNGYPVHESIIALHRHATNFLKRGQVTFVTEGDRERGRWQQVLKEKTG